MQRPVNETRTVHSTIEGITWVPGVHCRFTPEGFGKLEIIAFPAGIKTCLDRKGVREAKNPLTTRYGGGTTVPAPKLGELA